MSGTNELQGGLSRPTDSQQQQQQQVDVRKKRHPELQPYVPFDRFTVLNNRSKPVNNRQAINDKYPSTTAKKYVSMSRLDMLAQPKKIITSKTTIQSVPPSSLTSSNATSTTTSSLTSNKNYNHNYRRHSAKQDASYIKSTPQQQKRDSLRQSDNKQKQQQLQQQERKQSQPSKHLLRESTPIKPNDESNVVSCNSSRSISPIKVQSEQQINESEMSMNHHSYLSAASELMPDSEKNSANGVNYESRDANSLCRELEEELIAKGMLGGEDEDDDDDDDDDETEDDDTPKASANELANPTKREIIFDTPKMTKGDYEELNAKFAEEKRIREQQEEEKRLRLEEESRERHRLETEERIEREKLVASIMARVSQSPSEKAN